MREARAEAVQAVREEVAGGRLDWSRGALDQVVVPHPVRGRRLDALPDDEGSASWHESELSDADFDDGDSDGNDGDGGAGMMVPATAGSSEIDAAPATAVSDSALALLPDESSAVSERLSRISILRGVLEQLAPYHYEALKVHVQTALHAEERRARGRLQTNSAVASAIVLEREREMVDVARTQMRLVADREEKANKQLTIKALVEEQHRLEQARAELLKASTTVECMNALRSFEVTDL